MKTYLSSLLLEEQTYTQFPSSPVRQRRNQRSWRIHISGKSIYSLYFSQFHTEFQNLFSVSKFCKQTYSQFPSSPVHLRRNQRSWRIHVSGKSIYSLYFSVSFCDEWAFISQMAHWTALWPFRTAPLQKPQSAFIVCIIPSSITRFNS